MQVCVFATDALNDLALSAEDAEIDTLTAQLLALLPEEKHGILRELSDRYTNYAGNLQFLTAKALCGCGKCPP